MASGGISKRHLFRIEADRVEFDNRRCAVKLGIAPLFFLCFCGGIFRFVIYNKKHVRNGSANGTAFCEHHQDASATGLTFYIKCASPTQREDCVRVCARPSK